ncbi:MAG: glycoside hydrolase family 31 protein [Chloroflexaceae bacterium]
MLPTFLNRTVPVDLLTRLESWERAGSGLILRCATGRYAPTLHNYYGTVCETTFDPPDPGPEALVQVDFCTPEILRVRLAVGAAVPDGETAMVVGRFAAPVPLQFAEDEQGVTVLSAAVRLVVERDPWRLCLYDNAGRLVWRTRPTDIAPLRRPAEQWNPPEQRWLFYHRYAYPAGVSADRRQSFVSFDLHHDEHIYGFGESFGRLDKRETRQDLWIGEAFGNASPASYKRAPFYMSSRGYGLFVNSSNRMTFRVGDLEHTALSLLVEDCACLDWYVIYGPGLAQILPRYTAITGAPAVPPRWSFGLWMSRITYRSQAEVEQVAHELRARGFPCDVIHLDTGWFADEWICDLRFSPERFPDAAGMLARLRAQGFRVSLWQWPNYPVGTPLYREARDAGLLATRANGNVYTYPGFIEDAGLLDYSNPEAVAWIQQRFRDLFALGVAAIKADFGEGAPPDARYLDVAPAAMHNLYPLLYNRAVFEATEAHFGPGQAVIWARSAWAGSQRYPVHWSGDGVARFEDLACVLRAMLSFGLSGFPFYSHDIGGFAGVPDPQVYVRWFQLGLFSSHARAHGTPPREPWAYGEAAATIVRRYLELRYRLLPYIYSEAVRCGASSLPLCRAMPLAFPDDPTCALIEDQYLFGEHLLVAPVLDAGAERTLYLPTGMWVDFWSKAPLEGGRWVQVAAPLEILPLFVRAGALLPFGPPMQYVDECPLDPLTVEIYLPEARGAFVIHDQDGRTIPITYRRDGATVTVAHGPCPGAVTLLVYTGGQTPLRVEGDGRPGGSIVVPVG